MAPKLFNGKFMRYIWVVLLVLTTFIANSRESVGLVLSGGGAKGVAHIGVIKALEDNDIPVDYVTGTSMGAIVGSLYSCGWTPQQMLDLILSPDFKYWSTGTLNKNFEYLVSMEQPTPKWITFNPGNSGKNDTTSNIFDHIIPTSLINPIPMNLEFLELYSPYTEQCHGNFNDLFVPFRCVTSNVYAKHKIVLKDGSLGDAVRASMSFPLVFKPIEIDGVLVYDGGIYDNFPVDVMKEDFNPDFIIGVSVSGPDGKPIPGDIYSQLEDMIIQNNDYNLPADEGVKIQVPVLSFGVLDWGKSEEIYQIGYKTGLAMVDSIKKRISAREDLAQLNQRREEFRAKTPVVTFDSVSVTGATDRQAKFIKFLFEGKRKKNEPFRPIGLEQVKEGYYQTVSQGKLYNLLPQAQFDDDGKNVLLLKATVKSPWSVGVGGWVTSSSNSMLFLTGGYHTLNFNSLSVDLRAWLGQSYYGVQLKGKFALTSKKPSYLEIEGVVSRQKYYDKEILFFESATPSFIADEQQFGRISYKWSMGHPMEGYVMLTYGREADVFYPKIGSEYVGLYRDKSIYYIGAVRAGLVYNTLNNLMYPSQGRAWDFNVIVSHEKNKFYDFDVNTTTEMKPHVNVSAEILWKHYFDLHKNFKLGGMATGVMTIAKLYQSYVSTITHSPGFEPTPSTSNYFNPAFRSPNYIAAGIVPIWTPFNHAQLRGDFYVFNPVRNVVQNEDYRAVYHGWFHKTSFIGELAAVYNLPFASLSLYVNYLSSPKNNWNFGINFGLFFQAPKLLRR